MKKNIVDKILNETEIGYDSVAGKFSDTRRNFWRELEFIGDYIGGGLASIGEAEPPRVLDFGCGNGRLLELFRDKKIKYFGLDVSQKLIDLARGKYPEHATDFHKISGSDSLAFPDNFFNVTYAIAVFHHIPSEEKRAELAREIFRVTKPDGRVVVTVWDLSKEKHQKNIIKNRWKKIFGLSHLGWNDCWISFTNNEGKVFQRFHHAWTKNELQEVFMHAGFAIEKCETIGGNILLVGKRGG